LAGDLGLDDAWIAKCLDHAASKKAGADRAQRHRQGLQSLKADEGEARGADGVAAELRRIRQPRSDTG